MARPTIEQIAKHILLLDDDVVDVYRSAIDFAAKEMSISTYEATEIVEAVKPALREAIDGLLLTAFTRGNPRHYQWESPEPDSLLLVHQRLTDRSKEIRIAEDRDTLVEILPSLGDRQFEHLCRHLLGVYGAPAEARDVTKMSGDGGLDFFAIVPPTSSPRGPARLSAQGLRVAGQAKRWTNPVGPDEMEAFGGRLETWRLGGGSALADLPVWFRDESDFPIVGLFATTSSFTPGAKSAAVRRVVFMLEGDQIAQDLAWSESRDEWCDSPGGPIEEARFRASFPTT